MEKCWKELATDVAETLLQERGEFDWDTFSRLFYKRKASKAEVAYVRTRKEAIIKELRSRGTRCHLVTDFYFKLGRAPLDEDEARLCLPRPTESAGIRAADEGDLLYTSFMLCEDAIKRGHVAAHAERIDEAMRMKRLRTTSVFQLDREKHLSIFLKETPLLNAPDDERK